MPTRDWRRRLSRTQAPADPVATGLIFGPAAHHPLFVAEAIDYLRDARALVRQQAEKLREEDPIIPVALGEARLRRLSMALRIVFFSIAGVALLFVAAAMIWGAAQSHNVVVEVFDAPPSFVTRGISGRAVAAGLLGRTDAAAQRHAQQLYAAGSAIRLGVRYQDHRARHRHFHR